MSTLKPVAGFLIRFLVIFLLFVAPWPGVKGGYAAFLRFAGGRLFASFGPGGSVHFFPTDTLSADDVPAGYRIPPPSRGLDIHLKLRSRRAPKHMTLLHTTSRYIGYLPTAFVASLILATPIPWPRKWRALLWGLALVNAYVALKFVVWLVYAFGKDDPVALFALGHFWRKVLHHVYSVVVVGVAGCYILPLPFWILVSFRRGDWERITRTTGIIPPKPQRHSLAAVRTTRSASPEDHRRA